MLVLEGSPKKSIPPLISAVHHNTDLSGLKGILCTWMCFSESPSDIFTLLCKILIVKLQPVLLNQVIVTKEKNHNESQ